MLIINPYHLRYFIDAATEGSLSASAEKNHVSQSAVSQGIRALEQIWGCDLTTHQRKSLRLTDQGKAVLKNSSAYFQALRALNEAVEEVKTGYSGKLEIGCTQTIASEILPATLSRLCERYPKLRPVIRIGNSEVIKQWLQKDQIDLGFLVDDGNLGRGFHKKIIFSGSYLLLGSRKNKLRNKNLQLVVTRRERNEVQYFLRRLSAAGYSPEIQCELTSWSAIGSYIQGCAAHGICPDYVARRLLQEKKLAVVEVGFDCPTYRLIGVWPHGQVLGKNAELLLDLIHTDLNARS